MVTCDMDFKQLTPELREALIPVCARLQVRLLHAPAELLLAIAELPQAVELNETGQLCLPERTLLALRQLEFGAANVPRVRLLPAIIAAVSKRAEDVLSSALDSTVVPSALRIDLAV
jgi:hypothetical protein